MTSRHRAAVRARSQVDAGAINLQRSGLLWPVLVVAAILTVVVVIVAWPVIWAILKVLFFVVLGIAALIVAGVLIVLALASS
jgi:hypothetical protein